MLNNKIQILLSLSLRSVYMVKSKSLPDGKVGKILSPIFDELFESSDILALVLLYFT